MSSERPSRAFDERRELGTRLIVSHSSIEPVKYGTNQTHTAVICSGERLTGRGPACNLTGLTRQLTRDRCRGYAPRHVS